MGFLAISTSITPQKPYFNVPSKPLQPTAGDDQLGRGAAHPQAPGTGADAAQEPQVLGEQPLAAPHGPIQHKWNPLLTPPPPLEPPLPCLQCPLEEPLNPKP